MILMPTSQPTPTKGGGGNPVTAQGVGGNLPLVTVDSDRKLKSVKGFGYFLSDETQCPQIYIKPTPFEDNDNRKLILKFRC